MIEASKQMHRGAECNYTETKRSLDYISIIIESPASWLKFPKRPCALVTNNNLRLAAEKQQTNFLRPQITGRDAGREVSLRSNSKKTSVELFERNIQFFYKELKI